MHELDGDDALLEGWHDEPHVEHGLVELLLVADDVSHLLTRDVWSGWLDHAGYTEDVYSYTKVKDGLPEVDSLLRFDLLKFNYELIQEVVK